MLIKVYGEFWSQDFVDWGKRGAHGGGKLKGLPKTRGKKKDLFVDNWRQSGIYVLYEGRDLLYVGLAARNDLGARLRNHLTDRLAGRWNKFSWYGIRGFNPESGELLPADDKGGLISEIEAILISVIEPALNKQKGQFAADVVRFEQLIPEGEEVPVERRTYEKVKQLEERIDEIEKSREKSQKPAKSTSPTPVKKRGRPKKVEQTAETSASEEQRK